MPVAVNCCVVPLGTLGELGVTAMDTKVDGVTVNVVDADETLPSEAEIDVLPVPSVVAWPLVPAALLMVATVVLLDAQVTCAVIACVVWSV